MKKDNVNAAMLLVAFVAFVLWLSWPWMVDLFAVKFGNSQDASIGMAHLGQFGDSYGALNSLFTGGAFIVLIWALLMQREELSLQREELSLQREEMKRTRSVMELQKFEATFFGLLNNYQNIALSIENLHEILELYSRFENLQKCVAHSYAVGDIRKVYNAALTTFSYVESFCPVEDKQKYAKFLFRQISGAELPLICLYCYQIQDLQHKPLLAKYLITNPIQLLMLGEPAQDLFSYFHDKK